MNTPVINENGEYALNESYKEILRLHDMLVEHDIPHTLDRFFDGWQICYPEQGVEQVMDAIEHYGSYGNATDKLEIMGLLTKEEEESDSVLGHLTAEEVFARIVAHRLKVTEEKYWAANRLIAAYATESKTPIGCRYCSRY